MTKQCMILNHLLANGSITPMFAINEFGVTRLAACIYALKEQGYNIVTEMETGVDRFGNKTRWARYVLVGENNGK